MYVCIILYYFPNLQTAEVNIQKQKNLKVNQSRNLTGLQQPKKSVDRVRYKHFKKDWDLGRD